MKNNILFIFFLLFPGFALLVKAQPFVKHTSSENLKGAKPEIVLNPLAGATINKERKLVWSDEFNYTGLPDSTKWNYNEGGEGWGNKELQYYTNADTANTYVSNGQLFITARQKNIGKNQYSSARLITKNKGDWQYGRIEISAKLPKGRGLWPAIWMLADNCTEVGWPACGEIDIMEHVGFNKDSIFGTIHTEAYNHSIGTQKGKGVFIKNPYTLFHIYAIEWTHEKIDFLLDGKIYFSVVNEGKTAKEWPFDKRFHLLLNIAVGGGWGGQKGVDNAVFPARMEIDYVRVYQ